MVMKYKELRSGREKEGEKNGGEEEGRGEKLHDTGENREGEEEGRRRRERNMRSKPRTIPSVVFLSMKLAISFSMDRCSRFCLSKPLKHSIIVSLTS